MQDLQHDSTATAAADPAPVAAAPPLAAPMISATATCAGGPAIPSVLAPDLAVNYFTDFRREYAPVGPTEHALVSELARHAAALERWEAGSGAVERQALRRLPQLVLDAPSYPLATDGVPTGPSTGGPLMSGSLTGGGSTGDDLMRRDIALAGAMSTEIADRCERHGLLRSRAFLRTLDKLEAVQAARHRRARRAIVMPPLGFADEAACERYLAERLIGGLVRCPKCGSTEGCYLPTRKRRECRGCKFQIGLRERTVMARSPVPLRLWFDAVRRLHWMPNIGVKELAHAIAIGRVATVRTMMKKISAAMAAPDASTRLAGLDLRFARRPLPAPSVLSEQEFDTTTLASTEARLPPNS